MTRHSLPKSSLSSHSSTHRARVRTVADNRRQILAALFFAALSICLVSRAEAQNQKICKGFDKSEPACEIAKSFAQIKVRAALDGQRLGIKLDPTRFRDVIARQFINRSDFEEFIQKNPTNPDPYCTYKPKPATWNNWQLTYETEVEPSAQAKRPLTEGLLLRWNKMALVNTLAENIVIGEVKQYPNFGNNLHQSIALSNVEVNALQSIQLQTIHHGKWIFAHTDKTGLKWSPMVCAEDLPTSVTLAQAGPDCQKIFADAKKIVAAEPNNKFWVETLALENQPWDFKNHGKDYWFTYACWPRKAAEDNSQPKSCGMISYPDPKIAQVALKNLLIQVNKYEAKSRFDTDPIAFAAVMQRRFVALHPFNKGNGRVSRWVMDYVTLSHQLPPILVKDMDMDLSVPDDVYVANAYAGSREALKRMDDCLKLYEDPNTDKNALKNSVCALAESPSDATAVHNCQ